MRPYPILSILSVITAPSLACISISLWTAYFKHQIASAPDQPYAPDPGQFAGPAILLCVLATATAAAFPGMLFAWLAGRRKEREVGWRVFGWILNGGIAAAGCWLFSDPLGKFLHWLSSGLMP
ncbi:MAG: hypothetical protein EOP88_19630 [Verrucomicrobiaceae bacterium]|nr:MAG: hypothetical protein EOP88_19630 [Verrucomicrobiaceae bacterium]